MKKPQAKKCDTCSNTKIEIRKKTDNIIPSTKNILVVDDNNINRRILSKILSTEYNIIEASNGEIALSVLRANYESISVVLLDIVMPVLDGYEVLKQMHADDFLSKIPVIVTSGQNSEDAEIKALSLGANDYILKPYKPEIIKHRISNTIYLRETSSFVNSVQHDSLTGVYGKEYFYMQVNEILQNNPTNQYDLICFDIARFKLVNDIYGIQVGDDLLKHVGNVITKMVDGRGICGRLGADEFVCLIAHRTDYKNKYFIDSIELMNNFSDTIKLSLTLCFGIYFIDDILTPVNIMCDRATLAKESIKGKYDVYFAYYNEEIRQQLLSEQLIVTSMEKALTEHQFKVYFQPKYDLKTEKVIGAEALVRWIHPEKGFMTPDEFIPIFEKNGFITDLDLYVWEQCCKKMRAWMDLGHTATPLSVNVSRADIYNPQLPQILLSMIQKYEISPRYLHLEITETAYTENPKQLIDIVLKLKKLGFIIEMDDFGTGYSSLNMLSELPIDILKLDMRFIQKEKNKDNNRSILSFIVSLAKWMNLAIVAEGVETEAQVQLLRSLNCEYAQGYYYAKPMPQDQFEKHILQEGIQSLNRKNIKKNNFFNIAKNNRPIMLVIDHDSIDFLTIQKNYQYKFQVEQTCKALESIDFINSLKEKIAIVMISLSENIAPTLVTDILTICKSNNLPVILLYDDAYKLKNEIPSVDISDYVARPYEIPQLNLRIKNAIAFSKMAQFEREKEINAAIVEMRRRAEHDALTGLLNRAEYEVRIDNFFNDNPSPCGVFIILDIDNFKNVNDTFGHVIGDKVLYAVGEVLNTVFSETNIISRVGGDEFSLFVPYHMPLHQLKKKMDKICTRMSLNIENITLTCSAGACFSPDYGKNYEELYKNGDMALLSAKRHGKSQFEIFSTDMNIPSQPIFEKETLCLLDNVSDAMFVCDATTSEIIYINETACQVIKKDKKDCFGKRCYQLFWNQCHNCDRCIAIDSHTVDFYEETTYLKDSNIPVHIKARLETWEDKQVKVHYLQVGLPVKKSNTENISN